ncbi:MAG: MerR family transcriptional regulator [Deltaproteobacteria bacterium]|nr:MerR family transcriptional regulator [Deltaproteobacteria bacterium]
MAARRTKRGNDKTGGRKATRKRSASSDTTAKPRKRPHAKNAPQSAAATPGALPEDGKLYYRIGEVSRITGVKPYVLRYWESEFRWMSPQKSRSKQRLYRRKDIEMILLIRRLLHEERYTIAGARKRLRELGVGRALEEGAPRAASTDSLELSGEARGDLPGRFRQIREELEAIRSLL